MRPQKLHQIYGKLSLQKSREICRRASVGAQGAQSELQQFKCIMFCFGTVLQLLFNKINGTGINAI